MAQAYAHKNATVHEQAPHQHSTPPPPSLSQSRGYDNDKLQPRQPASAAADRDKSRPHAGTREDDQMKSSTIVPPAMVENTTLPSGSPNKPEDQTSTASPGMEFSNFALPLMDAPLQASADPANGDSLGYGGDEGVVPVEYSRVVAGSMESPLTQEGRNMPVMEEKAIATAPAADFKPFSEVRGVTSASYGVIQADEADQRKSVAEKEVSSRTEQKIPTSYDDQSPSANQGETDRISGKKSDTATSMENKDASISNSMPPAMRFKSLAASQETIDASLRKASSDAPSMEAGKDISAGISPSMKERSMDASQKTMDASLREGRSEAPSMEDKHRGSDLSPKVNEESMDAMRQEDKAATAAEKSNDVPSEVEVGAPSTTQGSDSSTNFPDEDGAHSLAQSSMLSSAASDIPPATSDVQKPGLGYAGTVGYVRGQDNEMSDQPLNNGGFGVLDRESIRAEDTGAKPKHEEDNRDQSEREKPVASQGESNDMLGTHLKQLENPVALQGESNDILGRVLKEQGTTNVQEEGYGDLNNAVMVKDIAVNPPTKQDYKDWSDGASLVELQEKRNQMSGGDMKERGTSNVQGEGYGVLRNAATDEEDIGMEPPMEKHEDSSDSGVTDRGYPEGKDSTLGLQKDDRSEGNIMYSDMSEAGSDIGKTKDSSPGWKPNSDDSMVETVGYNLNSGEPNVQAEDSTGKPTTIEVDSYNIYSGEPETVTYDAEGIFPEVKQSDSTVNEAFAGNARGKGDDVKLKELPEKLGHQDDAGGRGGRADGSEIGEGQEHIPEQPREQESHDEGQGHIPEQPREQDGEGDKDDFELEKRHPTLDPVEKDNLPARTGMQGGKGEVVEDVNDMKVENVPFRSEADKGSGEDQKDMLGQADSQAEKDGFKGADNVINREHAGNGVGHKDVTSSEELQAGGKEQESETDNVGIKPGGGANREGHGGIQRDTLPLRSQAVRIEKGEDASAVETADDDEVHEGVVEGREGPGDLEGYSSNVREGSTPVLEEERDPQGIIEGQEAPKGDEGSVGLEKEGDALPLGSEGYIGLEKNGGPLPPAADDADQLKGEQGKSEAEEDLDNEREMTSNSTSDKDSNAKEDTPDQGVELLNEPTAPDVPSFQAYSSGQASAQEHSVPNQGVGVLVSPNIDRANPDEVSAKLTPLDFSGVHQFAEDINITKQDVGVRAPLDSVQGSDDVPRKQPIGGDASEDQVPIAESQGSPYTQHVSTEDYLKKGYGEEEYEPRSPTDVPLKERKVPIPGQGLDRQPENKALSAEEGSVVTAPLDYETVDSRGFEDGNDDKPSVLEKMVPCINTQANDVPPGYDEQQRAQDGEREGAENGQEQPGGQQVGDRVGNDVNWKSGNEDNRPMIRNDTDNGQYCQPDGPYDTQAGYDVDPCRRPRALPHPQAQDLAPMDSRYAAKNDRQQQQQEEHGAGEPHKKSMLEKIKEKLNPSNN